MLKQLNFVLVVLVFNSLFLSNVLGVLPTVRRDNVTGAINRWNSNGELTSFPSVPVSEGQKENRWAPNYINRYGTVNTNFWDKELNVLSPNKLSGINMPDRCPGGMYINPGITNIEIVETSIKMVGIPSRTVPVDKNPTGGAMPGHSYDANTPTVNHKALGLNVTSGPLLQYVTGMQALYLQPCWEFNVEYYNRLDSPDSIHAHGQHPPWQLDGSAYVQTTPIQPNERRRVNFTNPKYQQSGTYFLHSHYSWHIDMGVSMPLILPGLAPADYPQPYKSIIDNLDPTYIGSKDIIMFVQDVCAYSYTEGPPPGDSGTCAVPLHTFYSLRTQWLQTEKVFNRITCQGLGTGMDVAYTNHIVNGRSPEDAYSQQVIPGQTYRIRVINSAGMTNYQINFGGLNATLIQVDGNWLVPVPNLKHFWVGVAQRADFLVTIPIDAVIGTIYKFVGLAEGTVNQAGILLYVGTTPPAHGYILLGPEYDSSNNVIEGSGAVWNEFGPFYDSRSMDYESGIMTQGTGDMPMYDNIIQESFMSAWYGLTNRPIDRFFELSITGINGFKSFNLNEVLIPPMVSKFTPNSRPLYVKYGDRVCIQIINHNVDSHAIHLHGHSFQVTRIDGIHIGDGARRDVLIMPRGLCRDVEICFDADNINGGIHPLHCHMGFHMHAGMLTTVEYVNNDIDINDLLAEQLRLIESDAQNYLKSLNSAYSKFNSYSLFFILFFAMAAFVAALS